MLNHYPCSVELSTVNIYLRIAQKTIASAGKCGNLLASEEQQQPGASMNELTS